MGEDAVQVITEGKTLQSGWQVVKFGDVVQQVKDKVDPHKSGLKRYVAGEHMDTDDLKIRRWGEIGADYLGPAFHMRFKPGQVLYGSRRTYLRKVAVPDFEGICANTTFVLESKEPKILLPDLLPFIMQTERFHEHSIKQSKGSVNPYVNFSDLAWFEFALPPLEEQKQFSQLLYKIGNLTESISSAQERLNLVFTSATEKLIQSNHQYQTLDSILKDTSYGCSKRANNERNGIPIFRIPNILRGELDLDDLQWINLPENEVNRYQVKDGDILVVRTNGNPTYVGRCVVARGHPKPSVFASYLIRLRVDQTQVIPEFLVALLNSPSIRRILQGDVRSSAGNFNINTNGIKRQKIPLPSLDEQTQFVKTLNHIKNSAKSLQERSNSTTEVKKTILAKLGNGM